MTRTARILSAASLLVMFAGCDYRGAQSLPLPGGVGGDTYSVTVILSDATNLVPQESCRSNDNVIGTVESVTLDDNLKAKVVCRIKASVQLPANAQATLRETSLLGERFVGLDPPAGQQPRGALAEGATLPEATTRVDPNVEMVLGALSQVLNGGSLGSLETITKELTAALEGSDLHGTIDDLSSVVGDLNAHRDSITTALVGLDRFSRKLAQQRDVLGAALDSIPGGLAVLDRQRPKLVATLRRLSELSRVAVPLIARSRASSVADLKHLVPVLSQLTKQGNELSATLERVATFPFSSNSMSVIRGDYGGFYGTLDLDVDVLNELLGGAGIPVTKPGGPAQGPGSLPTIPVLPTIPGLPELPDLPALPDLPVVPDLGLGAGGPNSDLLGGLGGLLLGETP